MVFGHGEVAVAFKKPCYFKKLSCADPPQIWYLPRSSGQVIAAVRASRTGQRAGLVFMGFHRFFALRSGGANPLIALGSIAAFCLFFGLGTQAASVQPLEIVTKSGVQVFSVEMATTEEEKETGLMFRKELADGRGMLFDFSPEQQVSMWMKNTFISLDMIFIRADGRILRIAENTEPQSTKIIPSGGLAKGVLEVIAGTAKKYGIAPGDRVAHPLFNGH
jgi:uncharacterized membrane protein (UPF0127 family)